VRVRRKNIKDVPEFRELDGAGVLPRKPKVSGDVPGRIVWRFGDFYLGGQGARHGRATFGQHEPEWVYRPTKAKMLTRQSTTSVLPSRVASLRKFVGSKTDPRGETRLTHERRDTVSVFTVDGHRVPAGFQQNLDRFRGVHPSGEPQRRNPIHRLLRSVQRV
jgi:hypothetical protein